MKNFVFKALAFTFLLFGLYACVHSDNPERNKAYDDMMAIHDEVMPEMGTIHKLEKKLKAKIENTSNQDSIVILKATLKSLSASGEGMMDWMHNLDVPNKKVPDTDAIDYMNAEKEKISKVSVQMKESIAASKALLGE
jgi:hypothetical protein